MRKCAIATVLLLMLPCLQQAQGQDERSDVGRSGEIDTVSNFIIEKRGALYYCFGKPCEGANTDYYYNNSDRVKISGRFKKGVPVDTMKEYYESGVLKSVYHPYREKYVYQGNKYPFSLFAEYDETGVCVRFRDDETGIEKRYDAQGDLISELYYSRKNNCMDRYIEYFPNRQRKTVIMKRNRYDYDESGRLIRHWTRKSERYDKKKGVILATFGFEEYDASENVVKIARFYTEMREGELFERLKPEFPASVEIVSLQDYKEVEYPLLEMKETFRWDFKKGKTIIIRYRQKDGRWVETERKSLPRL